MRKEQRHETDVLFTMVTFLVYALALLLFVSLGAKVYHSVTERMTRHQNERTAENYLREKIRQNDRSTDICVKTIDGQSVLQISEMMGEKEYRTYIYTDGGMLKELLIPAERKVDLSDGTALIPVKNILFRQEEDGTFMVQMEFDQERTHTFWIGRRSDPI